MAERHDDARVQEIRARLEAATRANPLPWRTTQHGQLLAGDGIGDVLSCCNIAEDGPEFVAHAPADIVYLLARLDALASEASDVARENETLIEEVKAAGEQIAALTDERDALLSELTSYRFDFNVSESHPPRLREPEYFEANGHRYEKTATCRCCDERYAWGWVGDDGICLHCVDGRADLRAERDAADALYRESVSQRAAVLDERDALRARLAAAEAALQRVLAASCDACNGLDGREHWWLCVDVRAALAAASGAQEGRDGE